MSVKIRLTRGGRKKKPFYRVVVAETGAKRDGRFLEMLGTYDPLKDPAGFNLDGGRLKYWLGQGAEPSGTIGSLIKKQKDMI
ncbi:MAG: 30S ribosomal protein S16 [Desulfobacteraceae bacterium]|nr:30S ribosomal protein S16 [Desulfobacteraceae bacterium]